MEPQEIFDTVAKHLFAQGKRSILNNGVSCAYRGADGLKCAVGALIADEEYTEEMDRNGGMDVYSLVHKFGEYLPEWFIENSALLYNLQTAHDLRSNWGSTMAMRGALRLVAESRGLSPDIINTLSFSDR